MTIEEYKEWYYELHDKYEETSFAMLQRGLKTTLKKLRKLPEIKAGFDPNQQRDSSGRWGSGGATKLEDKPCFKEWFKDSKVVDGAGKPLSVYHGTNTDFDEFKPKTTFGSGDSFLYLGEGFYFTNDFDTAESYADGENGKVIEAYISLQNPFISNDGLHTLPAMQGSFARDLGVENSEVRKYLESKGHDGVISTSKSGYAEYVAFSPNQIKSIDADSFCDETNIYKSLNQKSLKTDLKKSIEKLITYEDIFDIILSIHLVIGRAQADRMLKGIETNTVNLKARNPLFGEAFAKAVLAFLETFGGDKIVSIREEFIGAVIDYIIEKNKAGDSFVRTVRELQNTFGEETGLYRWQMQRIVRTETMSASNFASWEAMKSERLIVDKVWIATNDHRTRDGESKKEYDHLAMEGIVLPRETKFKVPNQDGTFDELMYPVDPNGAPGNTINCRCTIAPRPRRDKDGKLIFKPRKAK